MAFKMRGTSMNGKSKFTTKRGKLNNAVFKREEYIPQSMRDRGFKDDNTYNPEFEYDAAGAPIVDPNVALDISKKISKKVGATGKYGADPSNNLNIFGDITKSSITGRDYKDYFNSETFTERGRGHEKEFEMAVKRYKAAEKRHGVGNVNRRNMDPRSFDYLLHFGGPEKTGRSWIQQRLIDSAYGRVDNEPHVAGTNKTMYEEGEFTADKAPSIRKIQKNFQDSYLNIMNDPTLPDSKGQTNQAGVVSKKDAMSIAKELLPTENLSRYKPVRETDFRSSTPEEEESDKRTLDLMDKDIAELDREEEEKEKEEEEEDRSIALKNPKDISLTNIGFQENERASEYIPQSQRSALNSRLGDAIAEQKDFMTEGVTDEDIEIHNNLAKENASLRRDDRRARRNLAREFRRQGKTRREARELALNAIPKREIKLPINNQDYLGEV